MPLRRAEALIHLGAGDAGGEKSEARRAAGY